jgi:hypothetical protein
LASVTSVSLSKHSNLTGPAVVMVRTPTRLIACSPAGIAVKLITSIGADRAAEASRIRQVSQSPAPVGTTSALAWNT